MITLSLLDNGRGIWDTKIILPEHRRALSEHDRARNVNNRPEIGPDALDDIQRLITASYAQKTPITLELYDEYEELRVIGVVESIDHVTRRLRIDGEWFRVDDVVSVD